MEAEGVKVIAFDADDTLWDCQSHFVDVERRYCALLSEYCDATTVSSELFKTESANMPLLGYGCKAFTISLIENAVKVSHGKVRGSIIEQIVKLGKSLLCWDVLPLPHVTDVLMVLQKKYRLAIFTKGELLDQEDKLKRSGLDHFFSHVFVVSDKTPERVLELCSNMNIKPSELLMVGNSFKSDIMPAVEVGAQAVYVPFDVTWKHEETEVFQHDRIIKIDDIKELLKLII
mgnify:CR=1 FL=1